MNLGVTLLGIGYIGVLGSFATLMVGVGRIVETDATSNQGIGVLVAAVLITVSYDVGAYFIGKSFGSTPLTQVSPNKTQEGLIGGVAAAILIPFLILSLAALGLNILVGYCGQISLGTGAFMAVGAYAAYNFQARFEGLPLIVSLLLGGASATAVGVLFGIPSLRIKGLYLAVATLAAQFFVDWACLRLKWVTNDSSSGSVSVAGLNVLGIPIESPVAKYLFCLGFLIVFGVLLLASFLAPMSTAGVGRGSRRFAVGSSTHSIHKSWHACS